MDSYFFLLAIEPSYIILFFSIVIFCLTLGTFIVLPLIKRAKGKRLLKHLLIKYNADCAIVCLQHSGIAGIDRLGALTRMYLLATNDSLILTAQTDLSYKIEIQFKKITSFSFNGSDLNIDVPTPNGLDQLRLSIIDHNDNDGAFNRYALKHANIIDYIAARVPKKEVNIRL